MTEVVFKYPNLIHLVWVALAFAGLLAWLELRGDDALTRFLSPLMQQRLTEAPTRARRFVRIGFIFLMSVAAILALMRPQTRRATETITAARVSADIVVLLDVSRSMLAEDAAPNRLARARAEVTELLTKLHGHRVGLVAFAGRAAVLCPLTPDYGFFRMILRGATTKSISRGGTRIGDALKKAIGAFRQGEGTKMVLLITDGEDHDSYPMDAAQAALEAGITIVTIGFGSEKGSAITITDPETGAKSTLTDKNGQIVQSRLDGELLRKIALKTEGAYIPAGVAALDLESIVKGHIKPIVRAAASKNVRIVPGEQYPWFVLAALFFLVATGWVGASTGRKSRTDKRPGGQDVREGRRRT